MACWETRDVAANGIQLHYTRTGGRKPPLVLAHGVTDSGLCWTPVAEALALDYDVIMVDARGHGCSDAPEQGYDPWTQAADLHGLIVALGLQRPILLGHSMGAATTLVLAGRYPDAPGAILLEDPPGWWSGAPDGQADDAEEQAGTRARTLIQGRARANEERLVGMQEWFTNLKRKTRDEMIAEQHAATPSWSESELGPWADAKLQVSSHVLSVFDPQTPRTVDWPAVLGNITCPALLITADPALGAVLTEDGSTALQALVPQLQIAHIEGAGHNIRREQFNCFLEVIRAFLAASAATAAAESPIGD